MPNRLFRKKDISDALRESEGFNGGLKRTLSATNLVMLGIGAIVGTGIFVITGQAAASHAGPALTISFLISAVCCVLAGLCYAEFASMIPVSGSVYSYSYATTGEFLAWFIGWDLVLEYLFACSTVAVGWSGYMLNILHGLGIDIPTHIASSTLVYGDKGWAFSGSIINFPAVFIVGTVTAFLIGGVRQSALLNNVMVAIKVGVILLFIGFGISYIDVSNWSPYIPENVSGEFGEYGWSGILRGAAVVFFAYLGFDALSTTAQETRNPQKDMPRGILISLIICAVLYVSVTAVLTGIVNYTELNVDAPIAMAVDRAGEGLSWLSPFIKLGAIAGLSSVILVMMLGQSRIYYAISSDGLLPKIFSRVNRRGAPRNATVFACIVTGLVAGLFPLDILGELVSIGTLMAFAIVCLSILVLRRTQPDLPRPFKTPFVPFIPLLGVAVCLLQMIALPWSTWLRLI
ncbi:MAG: amino acid permease, partial [Bacteroidales bacterium]|nr:amino acid permease [Bacteroidales bacterium]